MRMTLSTTLTAVALTGALALTGCASEPDATPSTPTTSTATAGSTSATPTTTPAQVIEITVKDGKVTPHGDTVKVKVGKPIELRVTSDASGELHIHTSPAQSLDYKPGVSSTTITIARPGVVEAELEETGTLVVNLEAR